MNYLLKIKYYNEKIRKLEEEIEKLKIEGNNSDEVLKLQNERDGLKRIYENIHKNGISKLLDGDLNNLPLSIFPKDFVKSYKLVKRYEEENKKRKIDILFLPVIIVMIIFAIIGMLACMGLPIINFVGSSMGLAVICLSLGTLAICTMGATFF